MYSISYVSNNGKSYIFGVENKIAFDIDVGNGSDVSFGTTQAFSQIGETVKTQSVGGKTFSIKGVLFGDIPKQKEALRSVFIPFSYGTLTFNGKYNIRVYVKSTPTFSPIANNGKFTMALYAPYPFFFKNGGEFVRLGELEKLFRFPINYGAGTHCFGKTRVGTYINIKNNGNVAVPFSASITNSAISTNVVIQNVVNQEFLKINGVVENGEVIEIYRDDLGVLHATLTKEGVKSDVLSRIDETSTLFDLAVGDNLILATDDEKSQSLQVTINYSEAYTTVYED